MSNFFCVPTICISSSQNAVDSDGRSLEVGSSALTNRLSYTAWYLSKDHLEVGDIVRSRKPINAHKPKTTDFPEGTVVDLESGDDRDSFVLVKIPGVHNPLRVQVSTVERVTSNLAMGDWVRLKEENQQALLCGNFALNTARWECSSWIYRVRDSVERELF
jgi:hypothetical protein